MSTLKLTAVTLFIIAVTTWIAPALAAPFVVGDVVDGVSECGVFLDSDQKVIVPAANNQCRFDVGNVSVGAHRVEMTAICNNSVWCVGESPRSLPLDFVRPAFDAPSGLRLEP